MPNISMQDLDTVYENIEKLRAMVLSVTPYGIGYAGVSAFVEKIRDGIDDINDALKKIDQKNESLYEKGLIPAA